MTATTDFAPIETYFLYRGVAKFGLNATTFADIADALRDNHLIKSGPTYDAERLNPDSLQSLFLEVLWDEIKPGADKGPARLEDGALLPGAPEKRNREAAAALTLKDARKRLLVAPEILDQVLQKLHNVYVASQVARIQSDEDRYIQAHAEEMRTQRAIEASERAEEEASSRKAEDKEAEKRDAEVAVAVAETEKEKERLQEEEARSGAHDKIPEPGDGRRDGTAVVNGSSKSSAVSPPIPAEPPRSENQQSSASRDATVSPPASQIPPVSTLSLPAVTRTPALPPVQLICGVTKSPTWPIPSPVGPKDEPLQSQLPGQLATSILPTPQPANPSLPLPRSSTPQTKASPPLLAVPAVASRLGLHTGLRPMLSPLPPHTIQSSLRPQPLGQTLPHASPNLSQAPQHGDSPGGPRTPQAAPAEPRQALSQAELQVTEHAQVHPAVRPMHERISMRAQARATRPPDVTRHLQHAPPPTRDQSFPVAMQQQPLPLQQCAYRPSPIPSPSTPQSSSQCQMPAPHPQPAYLACSARRAPPPAVSAPDPARPPPEPANAHSFPSLSGPQPHVPTSGQSENSIPQYTRRQGEYPAIQSLLAGARLLAPAALKSAAPAISPGSGHTLATQQQPFRQHAAEASYMCPGSDPGPQQSPSAPLHGAPGPSLPQQHYNPAGSPLTLNKQIQQLLKALIQTPQKPGFSPGSQLPQTPAIGGSPAPFYVSGIGTRWNNRGFTPQNTPHRESLLTETPSPRYEPLSPELPHLALAATAPPPSTASTTAAVPATTHPHVEAAHPDLASATRAAAVSAPSPFILSQLNTVPATQSSVGFASSTSAQGLVLDTPTPIFKMPAQSPDRKKAKPSAKRKGRVSSANAGPSVMSIPTSLPQTPSACQTNQMSHSPEKALPFQASVPPATARVTAAAAQVQDETPVQAAKVRGKVSARRKSDAEQACSTSRRGLRQDKSQEEQKHEAGAERSTQSQANQPVSDSVAVASCPSVKHEDVTPRPMDPGDTTEGESVTGRRRSLRGNKRKRQDSSPTPTRTPAVIKLPSIEDRSEKETPEASGAFARPNGVVWTRSFPKISNSAMEQITHHRHANMFAKRIQEKDAPGYEKIILAPQDLKQIRNAIGRGNRAAIKAAANLPGGDPGTSSVLLPLSEDLIPPQAIINSSQLDREVAHMFANAVMYNLDDGHGPGPSFWRKDEPLEPEGLEASGGTTEGGVLGYKVDEFAVIKNTRDMFDEVETWISELRQTEREARPPALTGPTGTGTSTRHASVTGGSVGPGREADEASEATGAEGTEVETPGGHSKKRRRAGRRGGGDE